jgi:hypothetical protein
MFVQVFGYGRGFGHTPQPRQFDSFAAAIAAIDGERVVVRDGAVWTFKSGGGNWYYARNCAHYPTTKEEIDALVLFAAADLFVAGTLFASTAKESTQLPGIAKLLVSLSVAIVDRANRGEYASLRGQTDLVLIVRTAIVVLCAAACVYSTVTPAAMLHAAHAAGDPCADKIVDDACALIYAPTAPMRTAGRVKLSREDLLIGLSREVIDGKILPQSLLRN